MYPVFRSTVSCGSSVIEGSVFVCLVIKKNKKTPIFNSFLHLHLRCKFSLLWVDFPGLVHFHDRLLKGDVSWLSFLESQRPSSNSASNVDEGSFPGSSHGKLQRAIRDHITKKKVREFMS